jgi:hypothetical protein
MRPMLDELELPQVREIAEHDRRALAEHKPPGMDGSLLQNLGRHPTRLRVRGVATGADARTFVDALVERYAAGAPLAFTADIVADAAIDAVLIDDLQIDELAGRPERFGYTLELREHIEPVEPAGTGAAGIDDDLLGEAAELVDSLTAGLEIAEQLSQFVARLTALSDGLGQQGTGVLFPSAQQGA